MGARLINIPEHEYHADPCEKISLSNSIAKILVDKTPRHAWLSHPRLGAKAEGEQEAEHKFDMGKACHALLLEGINNMAVIDAKDWRTNVAKEERDLAFRAGKYPLLRAQFNSVCAMANAAKEYVALNEDFNYDLLKDGKPEQTLIWDEDTPFPKRGRLDWISNDHRIILDYKTTDRTLRYDEIIRHIETMGYDMQETFYCQGIEKLTGRTPRFVFLFQETSEPYLCQMFTLSAGVRSLAWEKVNYAKALWEQCITENYWPGYQNRILCLEPTPWAQSRWDERMELEGMTSEHEEEQKQKNVPSFIKHPADWLGA